MSNADQLIRLTRAAREFDVPTGWLREEADAGRLPCVRIRGRVLFSRDALRRALLERARSEGVRYG